jgi:hypothetical protein
LDNNDFLFSTLDTAITSAHSIDLFSSLTSLILALASVALALATVLPTSQLSSVRALLILSTGVAVLLLYWLVRRLTRNRRTRLAILRRWQREAFLANQHVDSLPREKVTRMVELIQAMEDISISRNPHYEVFDDEFRSALKN